MSAFLTLPQRLSVSWFGKSPLAHALLGYGPATCGGDWDELFYCGLGQHLPHIREHPGSAAPIIDQSSLLPPMPGNSHLLASAIGGANQQYRIQAQTITAGVSGRLTRVDLQLVGYAAPNSAPIKLSLYDGAILDSAARLVGEVTIAASDLPFAGDFTNQPFVTVDVAAFGFNLDIGDVFTLQLSAGATDAPGYSAYWAWGWESDLFDDEGIPLHSSYISYSGGTNYLSEWGSAYQATAFDRAFRTWVDPVAVPESGALGLFCIGFIGLSLRRSGARRSAAFIR